MKHIIKAYAIERQQPCGCPDCVMADKNKPHDEWFLVYKVKVEISMPSHPLLNFLNGLSHFILKRGGLFTRRSEVRELEKTFQLQEEAANYVLEKAAEARGNTGGII